VEKRLAFAMCGSFCTFEKVLEQAEKLVAGGIRLLPIMSTAAAETDTRFFAVQTNRRTFERERRRTLRLRIVRACHNRRYARTKRAKGECANK
jgi:hypothetical protein